MIPGSNFNVGALSGAIKQQQLQNYKSELQGIKLININHHNFNKNDLTSKSIPKFHAALRNKGDENWPSDGSDLTNGDDDGPNGSQLKTVKLKRSLNDLTKSKQKAKLTESNSITESSFEESQSIIPASQYSITDKSCKWITSLDHSADSFIHTFIHSFSQLIQFNTSVFVAFNLLTID